MSKPNNHTRKWFPENLLGIEIKKVLKKNEENRIFSSVNIRN